MVFYQFCKCGVTRRLGLLILGAGAGLSLECSPWKVYKHRSWSKHLESCKGQRYLQGTEPKSKGLISRHGLVLGQFAADQKPLKSFLLS